MVSKSLNSHRFSISVCKCAHITLIYEPTEYTKFTHLVKWLIKDTAHVNTKQNYTKHWNRHFQVKILTQLKFQSTKLKLPTERFLFEATFECDFRKVFRYSKGGGPKVSKCTHTKRATALK